MRINVLPALALALLLLASCHGPELPPDTGAANTADPLDTADTAGETLPDTAPDTTPESTPDTVPAAPEPELTLTGDRVIVDGLRLAVWEAAGQKYIAQSALRRAFGRELEGDALTVKGMGYLPWPQLAESLDCPMLTDPQDGTVYLSPQGSYVIPEDRNAAVLMYHAVGEKPWGLVSLFVRPTEMEEQIEYILDNGYDPIWFSDLAHIEDYDKPVILTFDDGYDNNYTQLYPILQKYHVKATIFVITGKVDKNRYLTREQIREMASSGLVSIESHTVTHPDLTTLSEDELAYEYAQSRLDIARMTGRIPTVVCYPSGENNDLARSVAAEYYKLGIRMTGGVWNTSSDPMRVNRFYVPRDLTLAQFRGKLNRLEA